MRSLGRSARLALAAPIVALYALFVSARPAAAGPYIAAGDPLAYQAVSAPLPARQLGAISLAALEVLRDPGAEVPSVLGQVQGSMPPGWPHAPALSGRGKAPLGALDDTGACGCATVIGDIRTERVAVLYAAVAFQVGKELGSLRLLRLKLRYRDGVIVYLNGREVARRNMGRAAGRMDVAERPHGPEWETFYIPVTPGLVRRGQNLLAVEVRPSGQLLAPELDVELTAAERATITRGPMVQRVGATTATIMFETDLPVAGVVEYGTDGGYGRSAVSAGGGLAMRHMVELTGLAPGSAVHYRVVGGDDVREGLRFHTASAPGSVIRFAVYGDVRGGHDIHAEIASALLREAPDFVLVTGDLVLRGTDEGDWQRFFAITRDLLGRVPYYPVAGNHDTGKSGDEERRMNEIFALWPGPKGRPGWGHWYSFDVADIHVVMLDSNGYEHAEQLAWLEADLKAARARGVRAIFAATHDGPYSRGTHGGNRFAVERYVPILKKYGVTLTFAGHDHLYQRGEVDGFAYMVSGGGGAPLYAVTCGVPGKRRCADKDGAKHVESAHHYIMVTVYRDHAEVCPMRPNRTPLEKCVTYRLRRK